MACGDGRISRDTLGAQPSEMQHPTRHPPNTEKPRRFPLAQDKEWYSKSDEKEGVQLLLDKLGQPTIVYPHVHVIHDERGGEVRVILSKGPKDHPEKIVLPGTASGNEVNEAVEKLRKQL